MFLRLLLLVFLAPSIWALPPELPNHIEEMRARCRLLRAQTPAGPIPHPSVGQTIFLPISVVDAGQTRFSFQRFLNNLSDRLKKNGKNPLPYDEGRSAFPADYAKIKGVFANGRIRLIDGHHHALAGIFAGSRTLPIQIASDVSHVPPELLSHHLWRSGYAYPLAANGEWIQIPDLCELAEDPYLNFAQFLLHRVKVQKEGRRWKLISAKGPEEAVVVKVNADIPFLELEIADALHRGSYQVERPNDPNISSGELKKILKILREQAPFSRLQHALLLPRPMEFRKKKLMRLIKAHLNRPNPCALFLSET